MVIIVFVLAGIPTELAEDSKFVPLNADDPIYGPPVSFQKIEW